MLIDCLGVEPCGNFSPFVFRVDSRVALLLPQRKVTRIYICLNLIVCLYRFHMLSAVGNAILYMNNIPPGASILVWKRDKYLGGKCIGRDNLPARIAVTRDLVSAHF